MSRKPFFALARFRGWGCRNTCKLQTYFVKLFIYCFYFERNCHENVQRNHPFDEKPQKHFFSSDFYWTRHGSTGLSSCLMNCVCSPTPASVSTQGRGAIMPPQCKQWPGYKDGGRLISHSALWWTGFLSLTLTHTHMRRTESSSPAPVGGTHIPRPFTSSSLLVLCSL